MTEVWSCGGGTQSAAIAVLIAQGRLPKPDFGIIVDTGREKSSTWAYLEKWIRPACEFPLFRVPVLPQPNLPTPYAGNGDILLPIFTNQSGQVGKLPAYCSDPWKRETTYRFLRKKGVEQCRNWFGISLDEMSRVRTPRRQWVQLWYPLIFEVPLRRQDCINLVMEFGWPEPPSSSCWMCPNHHDNEWRDMKENYPDDFALAVAFDYEMREKDPHAFLHESCVPLDQVDFTDQQNSFLSERGCLGGCFT